MISWLLNSLLPLTLLLSLILLLRHPLRKHIDANAVYHLWLVIPLSLLLFTIPIPWHFLNEFTISEPKSTLIQLYLVTPSQNINHNLSSNHSLGLWLTGLWLIGFISLISYWIIIQNNYRKALKLTPLSYNKYQQQLNESGAHALSIAQSSHIHSPILVGLFQQTLVIPEDFETLYTTEQQQLIVSHEACHFSQHHMWTNQFALMLLALFWFNPLAWHAYSAFRQDQEHACDQVVLSQKHTRSRIQYCKALILTAETSPPNTFTLLSFNSSFKQNGEQHFMFNRIKQIKQMPQELSAKRTIANVIKLSIVTLVSSLLLAGVSYAGSQMAKKTEVEAHKEELVHVRPTHRIEPKYPEDAAKAGIEGSVVLKFNVEGDGSVSHVSVINGKPAHIFDETAITALKQWRYQETGRVSENLLVQLDYIMDSSIDKSQSLIERITVSH